MNEPIQVGLRKPADDVVTPMSIEAMWDAIKTGYRDSSMIRNCADYAEINRLTVEQHLIVLAYHALRSYQDCYEREYKRLMLDQRSDAVSAKAAP